MTKQLSIFLIKITCLVCLISHQNLLAIERLHLSIEKIELLPELIAAKQSKPSLKPSHKIIDALRLDNMDLMIDVSTSPARLSVNFEKLKLPEPFTKLRSLNLSCQSWLMNENQLSCTKGHITIMGLFSDNTPAEAEFSINYAPLSDKLIISLNNLIVGKGKINAQLKINQQHWQANISVNNLQYQSIKNYLQFYFNDFFIPVEDAGGQLSFAIKGAGAFNSKPEIVVQSIDLSGELDKFHYLRGDDIADNMSTKFHFTLKQDEVTIHNYQVFFEIDKLKGELYQNEMYFVFTGNEHIETQFVFNAKKEMINFSKLRVFVPEIVDLLSSGKLVIINSPQSKTVNLREFSASLDILDFKQLTQLYLNNVLGGTDYEGLKFGGRFKANIDKQQQLIAISCEFQDVSTLFNKGKEQFSFSGVEGTLFWNNSPKKTPAITQSQLAWKSAVLNKLPLGQTQFKFTTQNKSLKLTQEVDIPIFDGALQINNLAITHRRQTSKADSDRDVQVQHTQDTHIKNTHHQGLTVNIDGLIKPISLKLVSEHFAWPLLDGTLSAFIPSTTYTEQYLEVGGAMMLRVFDGNIIFKDLIIEQPLQNRARLYANIDLNNLNLQSLTKTYNFGEIQGRVEGKFLDLILQSWKPVAFDGYIRTPIKDKSTHRISQRAIDNLSSLGGASGLLSKTFLSFFETFGYDKIGLSCKLKNNICTMSGVEAKGNSYYIVKGGGIPRIDVMGFQNQVNWQILINRLNSIQSANDPVIE